METEPVSLDTTSVTTSTQS